MPRLKKGWTQAVESPLDSADQQLLNNLLDGVLENNAIKFLSGIDVLSESVVLRVIDEDSFYCIYSSGSHNNWFTMSVRNICDAFVMTPPFKVSKTFKKWDYAIEKLVSMRSRVAILLVDAFLSAWANSECSLDFPKVMPLTSWSVAVVTAVNRDLSPLAIVSLWKKDLPELIRQRGCRAYGLTFNLKGYITCDQTVKEIKNSVFCKASTWCQCEKCLAKSMTPSWRPHPLCRLPRWKSPCGCEKEHIETDSDTSDSENSDLGDCSTDSDSSVEEETERTMKARAETAVRAIPEVAAAAAAGLPVKIITTSSRSEFEERKRELSAGLRYEATVRNKIAKKEREIAKKERQDQKNADKEKADSERKAAVKQRELSAALRYEATIRKKIANKEREIANKEHQDQKNADKEKADSERKAAVKQRHLENCIEEKIHTVVWVAVQNVLKSAKTREREAEVAHDKRIKALRATNAKAAANRVRAIARREQR